MQSGPRHSGEMSQNSVHDRAHRTAMDGANANGSGGPVLDPAARASRRMYEGMSASAGGLELGISVAIGALFGAWLDGKAGTEPWLLIVFLILGSIAGFRGVLRAVARAERADRAERIRNRRSEDTTRHG
ncbi:MAG TPA: AtpZ/AtpI family protein [Kofleriaceae bacterium]|nr:AtpZ/AtpI family protein [Kofleriaceae bacterium]